MHLSSVFSFFFFFNDTATTEIYTLSLHDALPISLLAAAIGLNVYLYIVIPKGFFPQQDTGRMMGFIRADQTTSDRKSTRLNSSHGYISYAVFCLKKKKK